MDQLNLPAYDVKLQKASGQSLIYDPHRKKYVALTPEEWVRQHFLNYLIAHLEYPKALIKVEGGVKVHQMGKRTDIVVFDRAGKPFMLVECKATQVPLSQTVFDQVSVYNQTHQARYLVVTNGIKHYCCEVNYHSQQYQFLKELPEYN